VEHAFRIGCHARLLALVGRGEAAEKERARAEAMAQPYRQAPQVRDMLGRTALAISLSAGSRREIEPALPPTPQGNARGTFDRGPLAALRAQALLDQERAQEAWRAAAAAREHPWATPWDRIAAGLVEARSMMRMKRRTDALTRAREALDGARGLGMPFTAASASALILELSPDLPEASSIRDEARSALARYLEGLPADDAAAARARPDVSTTLVILQSPPPPREAH
jgi:hypothetical protein